MTLPTNPDIEIPAELLSGRPQSIKPPAGIERSELDEVFAARLPGVVRRQTTRTYFSVQYLFLDTSGQRGAVLLRLWQDLSVGRTRGELIEAEPTGLWQQIIEAVAYWNLEVR